MKNNKRKCSVISLRNMDFFEERGIHVRPCVFIKLPYKIPQIITVSLRGTLTSLSIYRNYSCIFWKYVPIKSWLTCFNTVLEKAPNTQHGEGSI